MGDNEFFHLLGHKDGIAPPSKMWDALCIACWSFPSLLLEEDHFETQSILFVGKKLILNQLIANYSCKMSSGKQGWLVFSTLCSLLQFLGVKFSAQQPDRIHQELQRMQTSLEKWQLLLPKSSVPPLAYYISAVCISKL